MSEWYEKVGDAYLNRKEFGDSLTAAQALQNEHIHFEQQAMVIFQHLPIASVWFFDIDSLECMSKNWVLKC